MAREKTTVDIDLDKAVSSRRKQTGMHGTQSKSTGRGAISQLNNVGHVKEGANELVVSTDDCSLWSYNDRIYESLNMENCKSLIDDIQKNTQLQSVVARRDPSGNKKYEIIIGTRRFWACSHIPSKKIKIELIEADDKRAYKLMRSENAERDDTTAYEKAINAKRVIAEIYAGSQKDYCIENEINEKTLSTWMAIADMEPEVKAALPDMLGVTVKQAMKLRAVINKLAKSKKAVLEKARELKGAEMTTAAILKELIAVGEAASKPKVRGPVEKVYSVAGNKSGVVVKEAANWAITIKVNKDISANKEAIIKTLTKHFQ
jgi:ParB family chromosome partitioning protein